MRRVRARGGIGRATVIACLCLLVGMPMPGRCSPRTAAPTSLRSLLPVHIAAQPLASALERYAVLTDQTVLFSDELVASRWSRAVQGDYTAQEALDLLLTGTQLRAERVGEGDDASFVLREASSAPPAPARAAPARPDRSYDARVQQRVWQALCSHRDTSPGHYRALLLLEVSPAGLIRSVRQVTGSGSAARDQAMQEALQGLRLDAPPPPGLQQPLAILILPATADPSPRCSPEGRDD